MKFAKFVVRHSIAAATVVAITSLITAVFYFGLLAWAIVTNSDLGGPLALPGMLLLVLAGTAASVVIILAPVTALAEMLRLRVLRTNRFVEIPITSLLLVVYLGVVFFSLILARGWSPDPTIRGGVILTVVQLVLLGIYWWSLQATELLIAVAAKLWAAADHARLRTWPPSNSG